jgi:hypothetical protein
VQIPATQTVDHVYPSPPYCPYTGTLVGAAEALEVLVFVAVLVILLQETPPTPPLMLDMSVFCSIGGSSGYIS